MTADINLKYDDQNQVIIDDNGAFVRSLILGGRELLTRDGLFPMIPFTNRIKGGKFTYFGIVRSLPLTDGKDAMHGDGWKKKWNVVECENQQVHLSYQHQKGDVGYPFSYSADIIYKIANRVFQIEIKIKNTGLIPMPCSMGIHPFFIKSDQNKIAFDGKGVWSHLCSPIDRPYPIPKDWNFKAGADIDWQKWDTCFSLNENTIDLIQKNDTIQIKADKQFGHMVLFHEPQKDFICIEPITMTNDGFNFASKGVVGTGIRSLAKNEEMIGQIEIGLK